MEYCVRDESRNIRQSVRDEQTAALPDAAVRVGLYRSFQTSSVASKAETVNSVDMAATAQDPSAPLRGASEKKEDVYDEDCKV